MLLYANEDFFYPVVVELRRLGHDVVTAQQDGHSSAPIQLSSAAPMPWGGSCSLSTVRTSSDYTAKGRRTAVSCPQPKTMIISLSPGASTLPWSV